ncbi:MAG: hypothetical protein ABI467_22810 [Kofleriaceae bacterium]
MAGGRPTNDPKETLVAVRFSDRQLVVLKRRARQDGISLSEALRRCVDEWATIRSAPTQVAKSRPPTLSERATFKQLFSLFEEPPARRRPRRGK